MIFFIIYKFVNVVYEEKKDYENTIFVNENL